MNRQRVLTLVRKDLLEVMRNKQALAPILVVPLILVVLIPSAVILLGGNPALLSSINGVRPFLENLPAGFVPDGLNTQQTVIYAVIVFFMAPMFLLIPILVASVTAASAFVGEKERRTIEGLLYTPLTDRELVLGKVIASLIPSVGVAWTSFVMYTIVVTVLGGPVMGGAFFPTATWYVVILLLVPLVAVLAITLIVAVSGRSTTMQGAQGLAVLVILPVLALIVGQATGLMLFDLWVALIAAGVLLVVDVIVFLLVVRSVSRERIITRLD